jgi:hypothetical protein
LAEIGPHYDSFNESVIPAAQNVAGTTILSRRCRNLPLGPTTAIPAAFLEHKSGIGRGLAAATDWRDHEAAMTPNRE